jgi:hypothetical protein
MIAPSVREAPLAPEKRRIEFFSVGTVLEHLARCGVDAEFLNARIRIDAERVAKSAPAILAFEFFVRDSAWMGFQRNRAPDRW